MAGYIDGTDQGQPALFPARLEGWITEDHQVRVVDLFVDELDLDTRRPEQRPVTTGRSVDLSGS